MSWWKEWSGRQRRSPARSYRPLVRPLEDRTLLSFITAGSYAVGQYPEAVAVGDFNGDGALDLAVANDIGNSVSVLLGNGDGTFQARTDYPVSYNPTSIVVGDFNGDGIPDLGVACWDAFGQGTVNVLLGNGNGTFHYAAKYSVGVEPDSAAVGDFNGDGKLDLVTANLKSQSVSVLLGNGDGTFQAKKDYAVGHGPNSVAVGDFLNNGKLDLAVVNSYGDNTVSILLGNGDGTFQATQDYPVGPSPTFVAVGDFNGDGVPDLAVANDLFPTATVTVLLGNGDGSFRSAGSYGTGGRPYSIAVADFNGDGVPDLATGNYYLNPNTVSVLLGNGDGSFQPHQDSMTGESYGYGVAVGDFNGDGLPDIAVTNGASSGKVTILLNAGDWGGSPAEGAAMPRPAAMPLTPHDPVALPVDPPTTAYLPPLAAPFSPEEADGGQSNLPRATASPPVITRYRHAADLVFAVWDDDGWSGP